MINTGFVSIKSIIGDVYRDTGMQEEIPWGDIIEWTSDILMRVGSPQQFIPVVTGHEARPNLDITDYKAKLPCDFYRLRQIAVDGFPAYYSGDTFHELLDGECCGFDTASSSSSVTDQITDNFGTTYDASLGNRNTDRRITFTINNDYLTLSRKEGEVCISYYAFPTDDDGFPLIPDVESYKEAIRRYLIMKLDYINWRRQPDSPGLKALYNDSQIEFEWYIGQATSALKMPDVAQMESLKNQMVRLAPKFNRYSEFFKGLGTPEQRKIR